MARLGMAVFDKKGIIYTTSDDATVSDIAALLGRIGEGNGLEIGIAKSIHEKRREIEQLWADRDEIEVQLAVRE
jgi:hypothetical protein